MDILKCEHINKIYKTGDYEFYALKDINLTIEKNEYVSVVGKSGSGKTTLMNMMGLIDRPTSGDLWLKGQKISECSYNELADLRSKYIGYIFQSFYLEPTYSVFVNVEMPLLIAGVPKEKRRKKVCEVLECVGMIDHIDKRAGVLSGGEKQRVCIARALVRDPEIVLADEPCGNLDSENSAVIMDLLDKLKMLGNTIILITHNEDDSKRADRIIRLKDGQILC